MSDNVIPKRLTASMVRSYIDFDGHPTPDAPSYVSAQAGLQSEGVAGLWELLEQNGYAYLADEVGMGKTRQAMGVIATQFLRNPDSRVVVVCSSATLQRQWQSEWAQFLRNCYRLLDDRLLSTDGAAQLQSLRLHQNLREFTASLREDEHRLHLLRYSSFSRPVSLDTKNADRLRKDYAQTIGVDVHELTREELAIASDPATAIDSKRHALARAYCQRLAVLLTGGRDDDGAPVAPLDLVVFDEGQYLRNRHNFQNRHVAEVFRGNAGKWLFLSATPLHAGTDDIDSLDAYLQQQPIAAARQACRESQGTWDVLQVLHTLMIRRTRAHADSNSKRYGKLQYRRYEQVALSGADDPFMAMTMALVQKRLAGALAGHNNKFRQGECASFESLSSSLGRRDNGAEAKAATAEEGEAIGEFEPARDHPQTGPAAQAPDRNAIDRLNRSFVAALPGADGHGLPHAKLHRTVDLLFERSLAGGSLEKTLVFVRRIDTVEEIRDLLHQRFQQEVDRRINAWHSVQGIGLWHEFWAGDSDDDEQGHAIDNALDAPPDTGNSGHNRGYRKVIDLSYFEALKERSDGHPKDGMLFRFRANLLRHGSGKTAPLRGFLLRPSEADGAVAEVAVQQGERWRRFLDIVMGTGRVAALSADHWLLGDVAAEHDNAFKLAALQLCLLQTMRQSDFLVDLFILDRHMDKAPDGSADLPDKLLWLLSAPSEALPPMLSGYVANQRRRFLHWIDHFDLIAAKCFGGGDVAGWKTVYEQRVMRSFARMAPVIGRSGRLHNINVVTQFNFPSYPNILVCTDVLKEGVDMHLFCDHVVHYGVAWTSGDLEQRIGRVDRLGSLIGRRIASHEALPERELPQLGVIFPYLEGTLDQHQVQRVISAKRSSDLRMDLGKQKDDSGEIRIDTLAPEDMASDLLAAEAPRGGVVFFPAAVAFVQQGGASLVLPDGIRIKRPVEDVQAARPIYEGAVETRWPLPAFGAVAIRRLAHAAHPLLRVVRTLPGAEGLLWAEQFVAVRNAAPCTGPAALLAQGGPHAVNAAPDPAFVADAAARTCVWLPPAAHLPVVLLEAIGQDFWLLRACVHPDTATAAGGRPVSVEWLAKCNGPRTAGYLMAADGILWFGVIVQRSAGSELPLLRQMAARTSRLAANLHLSGGALPTLDYRARPGFPANALNTWNKTMKTSDVVACGQVIAGVRAWFEEAFEDVLQALCDDGNPRALATEGLTFLSGGLLHLSTIGKERFRLQAFLDLEGQLATPFAGPKMWWEIVVTPHDKGVVPALPLSVLDELPHAAPELWKAVQRAGMASYTATDDKEYRYLAVYHTPQDWERTRALLIEAFCTVRDKMRGLENFQHKAVREAMMDALT